MDKLRKNAKGMACPTRAAADVKGKPGSMTVGGSLGFLALRQQACVAINPKRIELVMESWTKLPMELNRLTLSTGTTMQSNLLLLPIECIIAALHFFLGVLGRSMTCVWRYCWHHPDQRGSGCLGGG